MLSSDDRFQGMPFDFGAYSFTIVPGQNPPWHMDERHISMLYREIVDAKVSTAVEIGSYRGTSSSAFIEALNRGHIEKFIAIEPFPTPELERVLSMAKRGSVELISKFSQEIDFFEDFIFIDGDHGWPAVWDVAMCLAKNVRIICMHDSMGHGTGKYQECEGSYVAAKLLREASGRAFKEDAVDRPGEATDRGFLVSHRLASSVPDDPAGGAAIRAINTQLARILRQGRESHEQHELISLAHKELVQKHHQLSEEYQTLRPYKKMYEAAIWLLDRASAQNAGEQSDRTEAREPLPWSDDARLRNLLRKGRAHVIGADRPISAPTAASPAKGSATVLHLALGTDWESSLMRMRGLEEATGAAVRHCCAVAAGARTESLPDRVQWLRGPNAQRLYRVIRDSGASCVHLHLDGAWDQSWNEIIRAVTDAIGAPFVVTAGGQAPLSDFIRRRAQVVFREAPPIEASEVEALPPLPVLRAAQAGRPAKARRFFARLRFDGSEADAELLQAVKESLDRQRNETSVIVYGDGPALGMAARDLAKYRSQVSFVGQLDPETLAAVAADSAVLVAEPAWLPALAVSLGGAVPLVTTRPGILETLGGERAGFPPFSVPLAQRIEWAVAHPGEERQFLTQCRKLAEARMKVSTSQYSTLYQERAKSE